MNKPHESATLEELIVNPVKKAINCFYFYKDMLPIYAEIVISYSLFVYVFKIINSIPQLHFTLPEVENATTDHSY